MLLAGLLPLSLETLGRWPVAGSWSLPVGDARQAPSADEPPYVPTRSVGGPGGHQGADLSNRRAGGEVRAAADGIVVLAGSRAPDHGYGEHVVLAHRLPDGTLAYSVYAHLAAGSLAVTAGTIVEGGTRLGTVGRTGDATAPHLHFEVRLARDPRERWEKAVVVDPLAFVSARQAAATADSIAPRR